jgi:enoyl-CoA hydratase
MEFETVIYEKVDGVAIIKFNRPETLNAISPELLRDTRAALADAKKDDSIRAIIFTGQGDRSFIAGGDIKLMEQMSVLEFKDFCMEIQKITTDVREVRKPVIGAINGWAMGGGAEVACICDWRICSENAKFAFPEPRVGLTNTSGVCQNLARIVGLGKAMEMLCSGITIDAQEAYRIGMVNKVVPQEKLMEEAMKSANEVKKCSPVAVRIAKETTNACIDIDMNSALFYEVEAITVARASADSAEGLKAFVEKRKPVWTGR